MLRSSVSKLAAGRSRAFLRTSPVAVSLKSSAPRCLYLSYSSWGDHGSSGGGSGGTAQPWQAEGALDIQRVTQQAMIHEIITQQTNTIQEVVPWFLQNMPPSYFRQVPEKFRVDHIKAIAAIKGTESRDETTDRSMFFILLHRKLHAL